MARAKNRSSGTASRMPYGQSFASTPKINTVQEGDNPGLEGQSYVENTGREESRGIPVLGKDSNCRARRVRK